MEQNAQLWFENISYIDVCSHCSSIYTTKSVRACILMLPHTIIEPPLNWVLIQYCIEQTFQQIFATLLDCHLAINKGKPRLVNKKYSAPFFAGPVMMFSNKRRKYRRYSLVNNRPFASILATMPVLATVTTCR